MTGKNWELGALFLKPGQWLHSPDVGLIKTILGSCVAVTMFHRQTGRAAICHAVMPVCSRRRNCNSHCEDSSKYVDCIVHRMAETFFQQGIRARDVEVKLFGGSDSLGSHGKRGSFVGVGNRNVEQALKALEKEELRLRTSDVGGNRGRKLFFDTRTGEVLLRHLGGNGIAQGADLPPRRMSGR